MHRLTPFRPAGNAIVLVVVTLLALSGCRSNGSGPPLALGDPAPSFTAVDLDGNRLALADYAGRPVILRFWTTDCKFCRADTPIFNDYFNRFQEQGLMVVYINDSGDRDAVAEFVKELDVPFPVVLDPEGRIAAQYRVRLVPQTIVLDPEHRIIAAILGGVSDAELGRLLGPHLRPNE